VGACHRLTSLSICTPTTGHYSAIITQKKGVVQATCYLEVETKISLFVGLILQEDRGKKNSTFDKYIYMYIRQQQMDLGLIIIECVKFLIYNY